MDDATVGARLRILRRWRGMTLTELAGLAGVSFSYLSMVERGQRMLDRRSYISAVAAALKVSETDLVGGPHLSADRQQADPHMAIPALREAFHTNKLNVPAVERARPLDELVSAVQDRIVPLEADTDYVRVGALLPDVLDELHWHAAHSGDEMSQRLALETLIEACITAATLLDDPVQQGKVDCLRIYTFPRERSWDRRLLAAERAADALQPHASTPMGLQVLGMISLHAALSAAVVQRPQAIGHWLAEADQLAARVPDDLIGNWGSFCQTNVNLWRIAISVERGESGGAVLDLAQAVDLSKLTRRNRKAMYLTDVGRGLARESKTRSEAVRWLRQAEEAAPQLIRNHPATRETVGYLLGRATATAGGRELRGMAARMGVPH